ncbi:hypothetical protein BDV06DRAFT_202162 [Aspergillus oleicola]
MLDIYTQDPKGQLEAGCQIGRLIPSETVVGGAQVNPRYVVHPTILDALFQVGLIACSGGHVQSMAARVPTRLGQVELRAPLTLTEQTTIRSSAVVTGSSSHLLQSVLLGV